MFTGIIEETLMVKSLVRIGLFSRLTLESPSFYNEIKLGDSISVCGVCLTVEYINAKVVVFSIMNDTLKKTSINFLKTGNIVNIERALKVGNRIDGHIVSGHVDCFLKIKNISNDIKGYNIFFDIPYQYKNFLNKGSSIAIEGISLTVQDYDYSKVKISIIPETLKRTNFKNKKSGNFINVEFDMFLKTSNKNNNITIEYLNSLGYM
ncbi:MAG: riboflavin synthase [Candidatus Muirbacterium halophilum]|nr:riboflavin synthase [Candidatus Muirbacterium halophilum]MCK9475027.1 riboflavin synthase [Candidatus Muirbacterium halophilum]